MAAYDPDNLRLIAISISSYIYVQIAMIKHNRDEYPVTDQISKIDNTRFEIGSTSDEDKIEKRLSLMKCILDMYPNVLLSRDMMAWNLNPDNSVDQVRQNIIDKLTPNPLFNGSIVLRPQIVQAPVPMLDLDIARIIFPPEGMSLIEGNLEISFSLSNFISKFFMNKVLADDETDYFNRGNQNVDLINSDANLSFFNVIVLMDYDKIPSFRTRYHANLQQLPLPPILLKELEDYCPTDEQIRPAFIW